MAIAAATAMIAQQVASKATRDALFLTAFPVTSLPRIVIASALLSVLVVLGWARLLHRRGPYPLVPWAFVASGGTLLAIGAVSRFAPRFAVIAVYLQVAVLGPVLISGFWSLLTERFDPREAKRTFGRVAAFAAMGGLAGGVIAERVTTWGGAASMLPVLGGLHLACAVFAWRIRPRPVPPADSATQVSFYGVRVLMRTPYLQSLGMLVLLGAVPATLLDYAFKASAVHVLGGEAALIRLFSAYYTGVALLAFAVQLLGSRPMLERAGLARTVGTLPLVTFAGSVVAAWLPGLATSAVARGAEGVLRNSLFRSGYELLFTPIPARDRRASKIFVDVGFDRAGDAIGGGIVTVLLGTAIANPARALLWIAAALSALAAVVALRLNRGYVETLESSLLGGDIALELEGAQDLTTRSVVMRTQSLRIQRAALGLAASPAPARTIHERAADLGSGDATRIRRTLASELEIPLAPHAIALLERGDLARCGRWCRISQAISGMRSSIARVPWPCAGVSHDSSARANPRVRSKRCSTDWKTLTSSCVIHAAWSSLDCERRTPR